MDVTVDIKARSFAVLFPRMKFVKVMHNSWMVESVSVYDECSVYTCILFEANKCAFVRLNMPSGGKLSQMCSFM